MANAILFFYSKAKNLRRKSSFVVLIIKPLGKK